MTRGQAEAEVYHFDGPTNFDHSYSSCETVEEGHNDTDTICFDQEKKSSLMQANRPPHTTTRWETEVNAHRGVAFERKVDSREKPLTKELERDVKKFKPENTSSVSSNSSDVNFHDNVLNMLHGSECVSHPSQEQIYAGLEPIHEICAAESGIERANKGIHRPRTNIYSNQPTYHCLTPIQESEGLTSSTEVTPAFLRRAAQDAGLINHSIKIDNTSRLKSNNVIAIPPPNSLHMVRERSNYKAGLEHYSVPKDNSIEDTSFYGADASALDGTFVSIRDLNEDDDVPSIESKNDMDGAESFSHWSESKVNNTSFPSETTSLLGSNKLSWQGGFFGSQVEREDRKQRIKILRERKGLFAGWILSAHSFWKEIWFSHGTNNTILNHNGFSDAPQSVSGNFLERNNSHYAGMSRKRSISVKITGILCFHLIACGMHDLFLRYVSYRNVDEVKVSWNGEGKYIPAYWLSYEGRVLNPFIGPGPRTLTAFGSLVPGLVLTKEQWWRVVTSVFQSSSLLELILHTCALNASGRVSVIRFELRRGAFVVFLFYVVTAFIGSVWSLVINKEHLITSSGMGISGLLAAMSIDHCFLLTSDNEKEDILAKTCNQSNQQSDKRKSITTHEHFTFEPVSQQTKGQICSKLRSLLILLALEVLLSYWVTYSSITGTIAALLMGVACGLLLLRSYPSHNTFPSDTRALHTHEAPPPPPRTYSTSSWREDDDSVDSNFGANKHEFNTPLMRRSILVDDDEENELLRSTSAMRKRNIDAATISSNTNPAVDRRCILTISKKNKQPFSTSRFLGNVVGVLMALVLTLIPASLIAAGDDPSSESIRASVLGCFPMRTVFRRMDNTNLFLCAGGCIPLSRVRSARIKNEMHKGRCDSIGFRCSVGITTIELENYPVDVGLYDVPSNGSCR